MDVPFPSFELRDFHWKVDKNLHKRFSMIKDKDRDMPLLNYIRKKYLEQWQPQSFSSCIKHFRLRNLLFLTKYARFFYYFENCSEQIDEVILENFKENCVFVKEKFVKNCKTSTLRTKISKIEHFQFVFFFFSLSFGLSLIYWNYWQSIFGTLYNLLEKCSWLVSLQWHKNIMKNMHHKHIQMS